MIHRSPGRPPAGWMRLDLVMIRFWYCCRMVCPWPSAPGLSLSPSLSFSTRLAPPERRAAPEGAHVPDVMRDGRVLRPGWGGVSVTKWARGLSLFLSLFLSISLSLSLSLLLPSVEPRRTPSLSVSLSLSLSLSLLHFLLTSMPGAGTRSLSLSLSARVAPEGELPRRSVVPWPRFSWVAL